jgi:hypothetical protein
LLSGLRSGILPSYYAINFAPGDALVGLTAIPLAYTLGKGSVRTYAIAVGCCFVGIIDIVYPLTVSSLANPTEAMTKLLGAGILALPVALVIDIAVFALLVTGSVTSYVTRVWSI